MITVLRRPCASSVIRKKRPRSFSRNSMKKCFRSTCNSRDSSMVSIDNYTLGEKAIESQDRLLNNLFSVEMVMKLSGWLKIHLLFEHIHPRDNDFDFVSDLIDLLGSAAHQTPASGVENVKISIEGGDMDQAAEEEFR